MPHDFIFNRDWHERSDPQHRLAEHQAEFAKLSDGEREELVQLLSSCDPREFVALSAHTLNARLKRILRFYVPLPKDELTAIWAQQKALTRGQPTADMGLPEDERVEDAGLDHEEEPAPAPILTSKRTKRLAA
jgi:hypothetical protein